MPSRKIDLTPLAHLDIETIWVYTFNKWSQNQGNMHQRDFDARFKEVATNHEIGKIVEKIKAGCYLMCEHHLIFAVANKYHKTISTNLSLY